MNFIHMTVDLRRDLVGTDIANELSANMQEQDYPTENHSRVSLNIASMRRLSFVGHRPL